MKKVIAFILAMMLVVPAAMAANPAKQLQKAKDKERKEVLKRLKQGKWELLGSSRSMEVALLQHWAELDELGNDGREIVGTSTRSKSKNIGQQMATNNAIINYAQESASTVEGMLANDFAGSGVDVSAEFENLFGTYRRQVEKELNGELKHSFSLIRTNPEGDFEVQSFFIVNESAASKKRIQALKNAMAESEVAAEHAQKINDFINRNLK
ncbi:MAG: hypothetical protein K2M19_04620 [Muribaculaceae bacterium]|nr:hypothetical protein [Muribaculaceae bacterium]